MLTKQNVESLKQSLESSLLIIKDMQREKKYNQLFNSEYDYRMSQEAQKICPDDYYKFRAFNFEICLKNNHRIHRYYIHFDFVKYNFPLREFHKTFAEDFDPKYYNKVNDDCDNYVLLQEYSFEECVNVFYKVCQFYLKHQIHSDKLFEIY